MDIQNKTFTFLFVKGWSKGKNDRSGLDIALKAFTEEFRNNEKVKFIAKINPVYNMPGWDIGREMEKLDLPKDRAKIVIITSLMPNEHINDLYNISDVYVSVSKAEGFDLPCIEAMACGKPCIVSNYGGHVDFVNDKNGWLIDGEMRPASDPNIIFEQTDWFYCDQKKLQDAMREAFENRDMLKKKGEEAYKTSRKYSWEASAKKLLESIEKFKSPSL